MGRNAGFAAAVNRGIRETQGEWLLILNNDVRVPPEWLETLVSAAEQDGVPYATGKLTRSGFIEGTFDALARSACAWRCGSGKQNGAPWNVRRRIQFAPLTAALVRRSLFEEMGLLDERFESYLEDVDFGLRCAVGGYEGLYVPEAIAEHVGSATLGKWNKDTVRLLARNQLLLAEKHFRGQPRWPIMAGQLLWGLVALRHGRGASWIAGRWAGRREAMKHPWPVPPLDDVRRVVETSEREIFELQRAAGWEFYWRVYFWLTSR
jgi:GT2 family glycosyltransferase